MTKRLSVFIVLAVCIGVAGSAHADVIFGDLTYEADGFVFSFATGSGIFLAAAPFVLEEGSSVVTDIHWIGAAIDVGQNGLVADNFLVVIFGDDGGLPDDSNILFADLPDVGSEVIDNIEGTDILEYWTFIDPLALTPGTPYHLMIVNLFDSDFEAGEFPGDDAWLWGGVGESGTFSLAQPPISGFVTQEGTLAFLLTDDIIPEPASMTLLGIGLVGLGFRRFRKTR